MPTATTPIRQATAFLAALFGNCEEGAGHILIWRLSDKTSKWFTDYEKAAQHAVGRPNVYVGVGLRPRALGGGRRGGSDDVIAIPGIWLDLDTEGPGRPSKEEALELLKNIFPQPPTVIIDTGGGYHPWWLFKEVWKITSAVERRKAITLIKDWQALVITTAQDKGWKIDNTADLARIMRIPGTFNTKYEEKRDVKIIQSQWIQRYNPEDLIEFLDGIEELNPDRTAHVFPLKGKDTTKDYQPPDATTLEARCPWLRHTKNDAIDLHEPEWYAMLGVLARCENGNEIAHKWSEPHPKYTQTETDIKLIHALKSPGPIRCDTVIKDFGDKWCHDCAYRGQVRSPISVSMFPAPRDLPTVTVRENAQPPLHKWEALAANDPRSRLSFERKRQSMDLAGCEISLATLAAKAEWSPQEICDLLIFHHVTHDEKPRAADHYARIVALGMHNAARKKAQMKISDISTIGSTNGMTGEGGPHDRNKILEIISIYIGIKVTAFLKYLTDPPTYRLETELGSIVLGQKIMSQENFRAAVYNATKRVITRMPSGAWDELLQTFARASIDIDVGPEATDAAALKLWLESYFSDMGIADEESEIMRAARDKRPLKKDGRIFFSSPAFRQWLFLSDFGAKVTPKEMSILLDNHGCRSITVRVPGIANKVFYLWEMPTKGGIDDE